MIGRWHSIDPLAEKYTSYTPCGYCLNNSLKFIDPDGNDLIYVIVPANANATKTQKILVDSKIADKIQKFSYAMNHRYGLIVNSSFRSREKQQELYDNYLAKKNPYIVALPGTSNHEGGFALDFNVKSFGIEKNSKGAYSKEAIDKIKKLNETAKEFGFIYLGIKDAVHFSINPVNGGYYDNKGEDIKTNSEYYIENEGNIKTYDPNVDNKKNLETVIPYRNNTESDNPENSNSKSREKSNGDQFYSNEFNNWFHSH